jgi:hypothetical protein
MCMSYLRVGLLGLPVEADIRGRPRKSLVHVFRLDEKVIVLQAFSIK